MQIATALWKLRVRRAADNMQGQALEQDQKAYHAVNALRINQSGGYYA